MKTTDVTCLNCGGPLVLSEDKTHAVCPFCDSAFLLTKEELDKIPVPEPQLQYGYINIVREICASHKPRYDGYLHVAYSLKKRRAFRKAKKYYLIPEADDAYLIYDATTLNTFKYGFALCTSGIYYRDTQSKTYGRIDWVEFKQLNIYCVANDYLFIGDTQFQTYYTAKELSQLLNEIKDRI